MFGGLLEQCGQGSGDAADEEPHHLHLGVDQEVVQREGEHEDAEQPTERDRDEEQEVLDEPRAQIGEEGDQSFIETEDRGQRSTTDPGKDRTGADEGSLHEAKDPVDHAVAGLGLGGGRHGASLTGDGIALIRHRCAATLARR